MAFNVSTVYSAIDKVSPVLATMSGGNKKFATSATTAAAKAERSYQRVQGPINKIGGALKNVVATAGLLSAGLAINSAANSVLDFDKNIRAAGAKFKLFNEDGKETFLQIQEFAQKMGAETMFSSAEAADGLNFLASAGFSAEDAMGALPSVINLATASQTDLGRASDIATDSLGAFGLASGTAEEKAKNFNRVADLLANTTASFNTDMESLFETIKDSAPVWVSSGLDIEEFAATVGVMANSGIKGTQAGTAIKNMLLNLQDPTKAVTDQLDALGVNIDDGTGKMKSMALLTGELVDATKDLSQIERQKALSTIFGRRAIAGSNLVLNEGQKGLEKFTEAMKDSQGVSSKMAEFMGAGMSGKVKTLKSAFDSISFAIADVFSEEIDAGVKNMTEFAKSTKVWVQENKTLLKFLFGVAKTLVLVWAAGKAWAVGMKVIRAAQIAWNVVQGISIALGRGSIMALRGNTIALAAYRVATIIATAVQWAWNAALTANPIGVIVMAIAALVAGIIWLTSNWDENSKALKRNNGFLMAMNPSLGWTSSLITSVIDRWDKMKKGFTDGGILEGLKQIGLTILDAILSPIIELTGWLAEITGADWLEEAYRDQQKFKLDAGIIDQQEFDAINAERDQEILRREREEKVQKDQLDINISDPGGIVDNISKPQRVPVNIISTSGGF